MVIRNVNLKDLESEIEKFLEEEDNLECVDKISISEGGFGDIDGLILLDDVAWRVVDKNLILMEGVYCVESENGTPVPDWSLTLIYENVEDDKFNPENYVYFEQDPPVTTIHNYETFGKFNKINREE